MRQSWQLTPVFLPGKIPMDRGAWGLKELDTTKRLSTQLSTGMMLLCDRPQLLKFQPQSKKNICLHNCLSKSKTTGLQEHLCQAEDSFQGLQAHFLETGQGPILKTDFSWECAGFERPRPELTLSCCVQHKT